LPPKSTATRGAGGTTAQRETIQDQEKPVPKTLPDVRETRKEEPSSTTFNIQTEPIPETLEDKKDFTFLTKEGTQLAEEVDSDKLLVEIVQGLLMAHARLDHMEAALRQAVETASLQHLTSFDQKLREIDVRFQKTTDDAGKAVTSLQEVRTYLVQSVEGASENHLNAFTRQLKDVDARFQGTAKEVAQTVQALAYIRDDLVRSVETAANNHHQTFDGQVAALHKNIDHLRDEGINTLLNHVKNDRTIEEYHYGILVEKGHNLSRALDALDKEIKSLKYWQSTFSTRFDTDAKAQSENWKNLDKFLKNWQSRTDIFNSEFRQHVTHEHRVRSDESAGTKRLIQDIHTEVNQEIKRNRLRLNWVLGLICPLIGLLGAIAYKLWIH
jgi:conjugal transfer/entry exclusion protein